MTKALDKTRVEMTTFLDALYETVQVHVRHVAEVAPLEVAQLLFTNETERMYGCLVFSRGERHCMLAVPEAALRKHKRGGAPLEILYKRAISTVDDVSVELVQALMSEPSPPLCGHAETTDIFDNIGLWLLDAPPN